MTSQFQSNLPFGISFRAGGYLDAVALINQNKTKALATMNQLSAIGVHLKSFSPLLGTRFYSHTVRAQLECGLAITKITTFLSKQLEDAQNACLHRIFGGSQVSSTTVMLHMSKLPTMQERACLLFRSDTPPTQSPWIVDLYGRYNENTAKTTSIINVLRMPPSSLCIVAQLSLLTLSYDYLCPSLKEITAYVDALAGSLVVDTKPALSTQANPSQKPMLFTVSRCTICYLPENLALLTQHSRGASVGQLYVESYMKSITSITLSLGLLRSLTSGKDS
ncbi:hypothetical protein G6F68_000678 [Rhizopus microsporus]|nr:hypothetical protein G6F67_000969 [Rhizopus microsporus]KAG1268969.1 hypothetical protein G6F68_000678 [Rhizopus microsporus]